MKINWNPMKINEIQLKTLEFNKINEKSLQTNETSDPKGDRIL